MRGFFLLLVLTNILFLGWQFWGVTEESGDQPGRDVAMGAGGLQLLSELDRVAYPAQRAHAIITDTTNAMTSTQVQLMTPAQAVADGETSESHDTAAVCYRSAPMASLEEASRLQRQLASLGVDEVKRVTVQARKTNYWVILKAYENLDKANEAAAILKANRIRDFFIVRTGQYENAISLGVFSTLERAKLRYEEIAALKVRLRKPQIEQLDLPAKQLIVEFRLEKGRESAGLSTLLSDSTGVAAQKIPCR